MEIGDMKVNVSGCFFCTQCIIKFATDIAIFDEHFKALDNSGKKFSRIF